MTMKLWLAAILLILILIFVVQNTAVVPIRYLFWEFQMSRALMIFLLLGAGILIGWTVGNITGRKRR